MNGCYKAGYLAYETLPYTFKFNLVSQFPNRFFNISSMFVPYSFTNNHFRVLCCRFGYQVYELQNGALVRDYSGEWNHRECRRVSSLPSPARPINNTAHRVTGKSVVFRVRCLSYRGVRRQNWRLLFFPFLLFMYLLIYLLISLFTYIFI